MSQSKCSWVLPASALDTVLFEQCRKPCSYKVQPDDDQNPRRIYNPYCDEHTKQLERLQEEALQVYHRLGDVPNPAKDYTCYGCSIVSTCPFAFDLYNLDGDCLAEK